jgi:predicted nucleotidyltransferase
MSELSTHSTTGPTAPVRPSGAVLDKLPAPIRRHLDELTAALQRTLGDNLAGLLVHGSAARGDYHEGKSDVDLIVVLGEAPRASLEAIANPLLLARYSARIEAMVLTTTEIPRAADVFPLLYDDIRRCHVVLAGKDPFSALTISDQHRRLRIEQELREAQIRLRRAVIDAQASNETLAGIVLIKVRQIRGPLRALLALSGIEVSDDLGAIFEQAGSTWHIDTAPLLAVRADPDRAHEALAQLLTATIDVVDHLDEATGTE